MSGGGAPRPSNSAKRRSRVTISPSPRLRRPSPRSTSPKPQGANEVALWYLRCLASGSRQIDRGELYPDKDFFDDCPVSCHAGGFDAMPLEVMPLAIG